MTMQERLAYLRGLADGMEYTDSTPQGKLVLGVLDLLEDIIEDTDYLVSKQLEHGDITPPVPLDLDDLEDGEEDFSPLDASLDAFDSSEDAHQQDEELPLTDAQRTLLLSSFIELVCPKCSQTVYFDKEMLSADKDLICPECGEVIISGADDKGHFEGLLYDDAMDEVTEESEAKEK